MVIYDDPQIIFIKQRNDEKQHNTSALPQNFNCCAICFEDLLIDFCIELITVHTA